MYACACKCKIVAYCDLPEQSTPTVEKSTQRYPGKRAGRVGTGGRTLTGGSGRAGGTLNWRVGSGRVGRTLTGGSGRAGGTSKYGACTLDTRELYRAGRL